MKLVFVHGINQQRLDPGALKADWLAMLRLGLSDVDLLGDAQVEMPYYGDVLHDLTEATRAGAGVAQGVGVNPSEEVETLASALAEIAAAKSISGRDIAIEQRRIETGAVPQGLQFMSARLNAILRIVERWSPAHGSYVLPVIHQAYAYLRYPDVGKAVDAIVRPALTNGPAVVVSHSLGTVVSFKILRERAAGAMPLAVPLFVTLGSPLAIQAVSALLGVPFVIPQGVQQWINAVDPDDVVTMGKPLDTQTFCAGIENYLDVANDPANSPHDIEGYLKDRRVADAIAVALG